MPPVSPVLPPESGFGLDLATLGALLRRRARNFAPQSIRGVVAAKLTALNIATLAQLAGAPPFPADVTISGAVRPSTTLSWARPEGEPAANLMPPGCAPRPFVSFPSLTTWCGQAGLHSCDAARADGGWSARPARRRGRPQHEGPAQAAHAAEGEEEVVALSKFVCAHHACGAAGRRPPCSARAGGGPSVRGLGGVAYAPLTAGAAYRRAFRALARPLAALSHPPTPLALALPKPTGRNTPRRNKHPISVSAPCSSPSSLVWLK